jgi:hypothetical protein|tara:strand:- start:435 stop:551 length:117 start_codon:yes stop_codon:yes gene_type:complete
MSIAENMINIRIENNRVIPQIESDDPAIFIRSFFGVKS